MNFLRLALSLTASALLSQAALVPILQTTAPGSTPGTTTYFYTVSLAADERIDTVNPASVMILDFAGYVVGSLIVGTGAGSWTAVAQPAGGSTNLVFNYSGPTVNGPLNPVFDFVADSTFSAQRLSTFAATDSKNSPNPLEDGTPASNGGSVAVPAEAVTAVPEPATWPLLGSAMVGLFMLRRRGAR